MDPPPPLPPPPPPPSPPPSAPSAPPSPPPPRPVSPLWRWVSDASTSTNGNTDSVVAICGAQDLTTPQSVCVNPLSYTMAGVRCCGTTANPGVRSSCCHPDSNAWDCASPPCDCPASGANYERCMKVSTATEAEARCAALGRRLCSKTEVEANEANGAGCYLCAYNSNSHCSARITKSRMYAQGLLVRVDSNTMHTGRRFRPLMRYCECVRERLFANIASTSIITCRYVRLSRGRAPLKLRLQCRLRLQWILRNATVPTPDPRHLPLLPRLR